VPLLLLSQFDVVAQFEHGLPEAVAKIYARQVWRAVSACHNIGVTHVRRVYASFL
jgi:serine/threonine protein kinase